jgi:hypothetical protein
MCDGELQNGAMLTNETAKNSQLHATAEIYSAHILHLLPCVCRWDTLIKGRFEYTTLYLGLWSLVDLFCSFCTHCDFVPVGKTKLLSNAVYTK